MFYSFFYTLLTCSLMELKPTKTNSSAIMVDKDKSIRSLLRQFNDVANCNPIADYILQTCLTR